jgi:tRNA pseudouridine55 synthase
MQFLEGEVLLIDKPLHWTSFDVVNKLRYTLTKKIGQRLKVGHAGTLDPLATGLLIVCTGKHTKQIDTYQAQEKTYIGEFYLGKTTPSYDAETEPEGDFLISHITEELLLQTTQQFTGVIQQFPPMFSAIKVGGKKLYELARKGREIEVQAREVTIQSFEITKIELPRIGFKVVCSKGTYIRSLAHDFGKALQSGAYLSALRRTQIGNFTIENAHTLEDLLDKIQNVID